MHTAGGLAPTPSVTHWSFEKRTPLLASPCTTPVPLITNADCASAVRAHHATMMANVVVRQPPRRRLILDRIG